MPSSLLLKTWSEVPGASGGMFDDVWVLWVVFRVFRVVLYVVWRGGSFGAHGSSQVL